MIQEFVCENLSNWYVRLNRKRFWGGGLTRDKLAAYQTLYTCLKPFRCSPHRSRRSSPTVSSAI